MDGFRVRYQTFEFGDESIHVRTLRDRQEFYDPDGVAEALGISESLWSLFGVIFPSSEALARHVSKIDLAGRRILEMGCGIGLSSLLLHQRGHDVIATDYHPEVEGFLAVNAELNGDTPVPFVRSDWTVPNDELGTFDLIVGSDLLYEQDHARDLAAFVARHAGDQCEVIVTDPGRGERGRFARALIGHGFSHVQERADPSSDATYKGLVLTFHRAA
ncbi:MAG: SAM-dependent methyltransferase [Myxococcota bacterium]|jgi:SAM-dependent methyltransferase